MNIPQELRQIWRVIQVVMSNMGFTMGLYLYSYGAYFHNLLRERGANENEAMFLIAMLFMVHNGMIALFEVPMGALGDALGRKKTVVWSLACRIIFFAGMASMYFFESLSYCYVLGIIAAIAFAVNYTLFSGTFIAWIVDSAKERSPKYGYERLIGRAHYCRQVSFVAGSVLGMYLFVNGLSYVSYVVAALLCVVTLLLCLGKMEESVRLSFLQGDELSLSKMVGRVYKNISVSIAVCKKSPAIIGLIAVYSGFILLVNIVDYYWPVAAKTYMNMSLHSMSWAMIAAAVASATAVTSWVFTRYADRYARVYGTPVSRISLKRWIVFAAFMLLLPVIGLGLSVQYGAFVPWVFVAVVLSAEGAYGFFSPIYDSIFNDCIPEEYSQERATMLSFGSMVRSVLVLMLAIPSGGSSAEMTVVSWMLPALILLLTIGVLLRQLAKQDVKDSGGNAVVGRVKFDRVDAVSL